MEDLPGPGRDFVRHPAFDRRGGASLSALRHRYRHKPHARLRYPHSYAGAGVLRGRGYYPDHLPDTHRSTAAAATGHSDLHTGYRCPVEHAEKASAGVRELSLLSYVLLRRTDP